MSEFQRKSSHARYQSVRRWIRKHCLVHRMGTHESQQDDIVQQQGSNDDHGSGDDDKNVGSDDDDETMRNHSEPLLSYHDVNRPHGNQHNHRHIDKTYNGTLNSIVVGNSCGSALDESLPPLPDTIQLVRIQN